MLIIGHRGTPSLEPENTIRSFKKAESLGVDMIEMDVQKSKDGQIVVYHDYSLGRLFGVRKNIASQTLSGLKELSEGREIASLPEVLAAINSPINIEIKVHGLEVMILEAIKNFSSKVLISSFYPGVLEKIRALDANIALGLIIGRGELHLIPIIERIVHKINLYSVHPYNYLTNRLTMKKFRVVGKKVFVWTVNSQREYERMKKLGVDEIFTDFPQLFIK